MVVVTALVVMVGDRDNGGCRSGGHRGVSDGRGSMIVIGSLSWGCCIVVRVVVLAVVVLPAVTIFVVVIVLQVVVVVVVVGMEMVVALVGNRGGL